MLLQFKWLFQCQKLSISIYGLRYRSFPVQLRPWVNSLINLREFFFESGLPPALKNKLLSLFLVWVFLVSTFPLFSIILPGWFFIFSDIISNLRLMLMLYYKLCHAICVIIPGSLLGMFRTDNPFWDGPVPPRTDWDCLVPQHTYT